jgi:hypothetical protein
LLISCTPGPAMALIVVIIVVVIIGIGILHTIWIWNRGILDNGRCVKVLVLRDEGWVDILLPTWVEIYVSLWAVWWSLVDGAGDVKVGCLLGHGDNKEW